MCCPCPSAGFSSLGGGSILVVAVGVGGPRGGGGRCEVSLAVFQCLPWDMDAVSSPTCTMLTSPRYGGAGDSSFETSDPFPGGYWWESEAERILWGKGPRHQQALFYGRVLGETKNNSNDCRHYHARAAPCQALHVDSHGLPCRCLTASPKKGI